MGNQCRVEEFYCYRDENKIFSKEFFPEDKNKEIDRLPAMILCHGFGDNCDGISRECEHFATIGYAVYSFDFCGGSAPGLGKRSDGEDIDMTIRSETEDLLQVYEYVKNLTYVDAEHITFMGFSQGGFIANLAAAKLSDQIENLILVYPALCIPDHARLGCLGGGSFDPSTAPEKIDCPNGMTLGKQFFYQASYLDPFKEMVFYKGRVLIIHGEMDEVVNFSYSIKASQSFFLAKECYIMLIRNAGHGFEAEKTESLYIAAENFLEGKTELLTIQVFITGQEKMENDEAGNEIYAVRFVGYCDSEIFRGAIAREGVDVQTHLPDGEIRLYADYTLTGLDNEGKSCSIHIVNEKKGERFKPVIDTDSAALSFLKDKDLTAALEGFDGGLTVRIWG